MPPTMGVTAAVQAEAQAGRAPALGTRIDLDRVGKRYRIGDSVVDALVDVDLHVDESSFVVILGPSGSGKTTLLNMIGLLDTPTTGTIRLAGRDVTNASRKARYELRRTALSFIFQTFNLFPALTALENVQFGADVAARDEPRRVALDVLDQVGLAARAHHFAHQLSGGEQQRVAIARALATGNPILLADEPTGELDFHTGVQVLELLQAQADGGKTVVVVTHNREIARAADRVVQLSSGRIVSDGPPEGGRTALTELRW